MIETKFYMVWRSGGNSPAKRHASKTDARAEATRLARQHPGLSFYVLSALECVTVSEPVQVIKLPDPPADWMA